MIGDRKIAGTHTFRVRSPLNSKELDPPFHMASELDVDAALRLADEAFQTYRETTGQARATFLERIGEEIMAIGDALIARAHVETGLPEARFIASRNMRFSGCPSRMLFTTAIPCGARLRLRCNRTVRTRCQGSLAETH